MKLNARQIKTFLKEAGFETKGIRVRVEHMGYSDTYIKVKLFDLNLPLRKIQEILKEQYEDIRRYHDGEILQGCNSFVMVTYDWETQHQEIEAKMEEAQELLDSLSQYNCHEGQGEIFKEDEEKVIYIYPVDKRMTVRRNGEIRSIWYDVSDSYKMAKFLVTLEHWK